MLGDDLYSRQPFCRQVLLHNDPFIFVCKPDSHPYLYGWIGDLEPDVDLHTQTRRVKNKGHWETHTCRYARRVPLVEGEDALLVNWMEWTVQVGGKQTDKNAFVTGHDITDETVFDLAEAGRARWKIENENNNTLKTKRRSP